MILSSRTRIARILVNRRKENMVVALENRLGAIAVMGIEIPDRDFVGPKIFLGEQGSDGDLVQVTETHRLRARGVVPGRPHQ